MFRFSLKTLFAAVSAVAVMCCVFFTMPDWISVIVLIGLLILMPPALIAGIVYGRGNARAFSIGGIMPFAGGATSFYLYTPMILFGGLSQFTEASRTVKLFFLVVFTLVILSGLVSMTVRWLALRAAAQDATMTASAAPAEPQPYSVLHRRVTTIHPDTSQEAVGDDLGGHIADVQK